MTKDALDTIKRLSAARHDGEASWDELCNALDECAGEIERLRAALHAVRNEINSAADEVAEIAREALKDE